MIDATLLAFVEDDPEISKLLAEDLARDGFGVARAETRAALDHLMAGG